MNRRLPVCSVLVLILLGVARPADASMQAFLDWLQEMSGPGAFSGLGIEWRYMCYGRVVPINIQTGATVPGATEQDDAAFQASPKCNYLDKKSRQTYFGISAAYLSTSDSPYAPTEGTAALSPEVRAIPVTLTFDTSLRGRAMERSVKEGSPLRFFDVGLAVGWVFFSGQRFETFSTYRLIPRLTFKPGAAIEEHWWLDALDFKVGVQIIGSVRPEQFGGVPGESSGAHAAVYLTASIDMERLFSYPRR